MKRPPFIQVDLSALTALFHECTGCAGTEACCCSRYEVCVTPREMKTIIGALPLAARLCPWLKKGTGFDNVFDEVDRGLFAIDTHEDGLCVFAYACDSGIRCSLHSVAGQMGLQPHHVKPFSCTLWPLMLHDPPQATLSICEDIGQFPCNRPQKAKNRTLAPELLDTLEKLLGGVACRQIVKAARQGRQTTKVALHGPLARSH